jgi:flagellar hook-associated protein 3 FlgL
MISNLDPASELFLSNLTSIQRRLAEASRQVSSGKKIASASDAPDQVGTLLQLRAARQRNTQIQSNLVTAKADADAADGALAAAIKLIDRAQLVAVQGASFTQTSETLGSLAQEAQSLQEQMLAFSRTMVQGRYIFSGDSSDSPTYTLDLTSTNNGVVQLTNGGATTRVEDPSGGSFTAGKDAQEIFDTRNEDGTSAADNVFAALNNLRLVLLSNDPGIVAGTVQGLKEAAAHLNAMQGFYGGVQTRIRDAMDFANKYDFRLQAEIADKEDADVAAAAIALSNGRVQLEAALRMRASMPRSTLFDFLG